MVARPRFFRDFTWANKLLLGLAVATAGFIVAHKLAYRGWQRQYWSTDVCGEPTDRFALLNGGFDCDGDRYVSLYNDDTWVRLVSDSVAAFGPDNAYYPSLKGSDENAFRLPPRTLEITWYSWRENHFYQGTFTLPAARIDSLCAAYRAHIDSTGWYFHRQPRNYDALPAETEPGFLLSVRLETGGHLRVEVLEPQNRQYARPITLARYQATPFQPRWQPDDWQLHRARSLPAYRDSLINQLDSTGRAELRAMLIIKKAR